MSQRSNVSRSVRNGQTIKPVQTYFLENAERFLVMLLHHTYFDTEDIWIACFSGNELRNCSTSILDYSSPEMTLANHTNLISHKRCKNFDQTTFATLAANFCTASSPVELHHERQIRTPWALAGAAAAIRAPAHFYKCSVLDILITWKRRDLETSLRKSIEFWDDVDDASCVHGNKWGRRRTLARPLPLHYQVIITRPWQPPSAPDPR